MLYLLLAPRPNIILLPKSTLKSQNLSLQWLRPFYGQVRSWFNISYYMLNNQLHAKLWKRVDKKFRWIKTPCCCNAALLCILKDDSPLNFAIIYTKTTFWQTFWISYIVVLHCANYVLNFSLSILKKNFVKLILLPLNYVASWFHEIFYKWQKFCFFHTVSVLELLFMQTMFESKFS